MTLAVLVLVRILAFPFQVGQDTITSCIATHIIILSQEAIEGHTTQSLNVDEFILALTD